MKINKLPLKKKVNLTDLIFSIKRDFPSWDLRNMSSDKTLAEKAHYHISSVNKPEKGVLELTYFYKNPMKVHLKIADNRRTVWSTDAIKQLVTYLQKQIL